MIAASLGTKSAAAIEQHFVVLLDDVAAMEAGSIELPEYADKDGFPSSGANINTLHLRRSRWRCRGRRPDVDEDEHRRIIDLETNDCKKSIPKEPRRCVLRRSSCLLWK